MSGRIFVCRKRCASSINDILTEEQKVRFQNILGPLALHYVSIFCAERSVKIEISGGIPRRMG